MIYSKATLTLSLSPFISGTHPEFGGCAKGGIDTVDNPSPETDENGHGTHIGGIVISNKYGLATAIAMKVLNRNESGSVQ